MLRLLLVALAACGATPARPVVATGSGSAAATLPDEPIEEAAGPFEDYPAHPWGGDSLDKLPKVDVTPYAKATRAPSAAALHTGGEARRIAQDWRGAEQKYVAALALDPGHVAARYGLATVSIRLGSPDRALALLLELRTAGCRDCLAAVNRARWDDDWASLWDRIAFGRIGYRVHDRKWAEQLQCLGIETPDGCTRDGKLHGPHYRTGFGADWGGHGNSEEFGEYREGKKHGLWTQTHGNGATGFSTLDFGAYVDDVKHGLWVHEEAGRRDGKTVLEKWVRGKRQGFVRTRESYRDSDESELGEATLEETAYVDDVPDGPTKHWSSAVLRREGMHRRGKQHGRWIEYESGKAVAETEFLDGEKHGAWILRASDGATRYTGTWERGQPIGEHAYWHAGKLLGKTTIRSGTGDWIAYDNNVLVEKGRLVAGKREGRWTFYDHGLWFEGVYLKGRRTGTWTTRDSSRIRIAEGPYVDDKRHGAWTFWRGKLVRAKGRYVRDAVDGAWTIFFTDEAGKPGSQRLGFRAGALVEVDERPASKVELSNYATMQFALDPEQVSSAPNPFAPPEPSEPDEP